MALDAIESNGQRTRPAEAATWIYDQPCNPNRGQPPCLGI